MFGKTHSVLVEQRSDRDSSKLIARTDHDRKVVFSGSESLVGSFVKVRFNDLYHETFVGELAS